MNGGESRRKKVAGLAFCGGEKHLVVRSWLVVQFAPARARQDACCHGSVCVVWAGGMGGGTCHAVHASWLAPAAAQAGLPRRALNNGTHFPIPQFPPPPLGSFRAAPPAPTRCPPSSQRPHGPSTSAQRGFGAAPGSGGRRCRPARGAGRDAAPQMRPLRQGPTREGARGGCPARSQIGSPAG